MPDYHPAASNPLFGNPLHNRADVACALDRLFMPLVKYFSPGAARVRLGSTAALYDTIAVELEGFASPLWGLAPWAAGGGHFHHWDLYREGLTNGTDPHHPEYWGTPGGSDQRLVEMAAVGVALRLIPQLLWEPLTAKAKQQLVNYLNYARALPPINNNWKFFPLLIDLGLEEIGIKVDSTLADQSLRDIDHFYLGDGWYRDGDVRRADHYLGFSWHFYGLLYAALKRKDEGRCDIFRERAALFARDFQHWFDVDGGTLAFGRSMTYRFAASAMWGALSFAGVDVFSPHQLKRRYLQHLRWWSQHPIADRDGVLSVGYGYPNLLMAEAYNSPASPYWAFKAFLPLALAQDHLFWQADEAPISSESKPVALKHPGMVIMHTPGNVTALSSGQECMNMRGGSEKYAKFIYSSRYAFNIESDERMFSLCAFDGMLGLSENGRHFRVRERNKCARLAGNILYALWKPWPDVKIETWLVPANNWHIRVHRINSGRVLLSTEGGFAINSPNHMTCQTTADTAVAQGDHDLSIICDLAKDKTRRPHVHRAQPNTNLLHPRTVVPQLRGKIDIGTRLFITAALVAPLTAGQPPRPPTAPCVKDLEALVEREGIDVSVMRIKN